MQSTFVKTAVNTTRVACLPRLLMVGRNGSKLIYNPGEACIAAKPVPRRIKLQLAIIRAPGILAKEVSRSIAGSTSPTQA